MLALARVSLHGTTVISKRGYGSLSCPLFVYACVSLSLSPSLVSLTQLHLPTVVLLQAGKKRARDDDDGSSDSAEESEPDSEDDAAAGSSSEEEEGSEAGDSEAESDEDKPLPGKVAGLAACWLWQVWLQEHACCCNLPAVAGS